MEISMMENGKMTNSMEMENKLLQATNMKVTSTMASKRAKGTINGKMVRATREVGRMIYLMEKVSIYGLMEECMKVNGRKT